MLAVSPPVQMIERAEQIKGSIRNGVEHLLRVPSSQLNAAAGTSKTWEILVHGRWTLRTAAIQAAAASASKRALSSRCSGRGLAASAQGWRA